MKKIIVGIVFIFTVSFAFASNEDTRSLKFENQDIEYEIVDTTLKTCTIRINGTYDGKEIDVTITVEADNCAVAAGKLLKEFAK